MNETQSEVQQEIFKFGFKTILYMAVPFVVVIAVASIVSYMRFNF